MTLNNAPRSRFGDFLISVTGQRADLVPEQSLRNKYIIGGAMLLVIPTMAMIAMTIDLHLLGIPAFMLPLWVPLFGVLIYLLDRWIFSSPSLKDGFGEKAKTVAIRGSTALIFAVFSVHGFLLLAVGDELDQILRKRDFIAAKAIEEDIRKNGSEAISIAGNTAKIKIARDANREIEGNVEAKTALVGDNVGCVGDTKRAHDGDWCGYAGYALKLQKDVDDYKKSSAPEVKTNSTTIDTAETDNVRLQAAVETRVEKETAEFKDAPGLGAKTQLLFEGMVKSPFEHLGWWLFFLVLLAVDTAILILKISAAPTRIDFEARAELARNREIEAARVSSPEYAAFIKNTVALWAAEQLAAEKALIAEARIQREARSAEGRASQPTFSAWGPANDATPSGRGTVTGTGSSRRNLLTLPWKRGTATLLAVAVIGSGLVIAVDRYTSNDTHKTNTSNTRAVSNTGKAITVDVSPNKVTRVDVPGVGSLTGKAGAFTSDGTMTVTPIKADFPGDLGVVSAGDGFDVTFDNTSLKGKLTVAAPAKVSRPEGAVPVYAHRKHDGTWEVLPAKVVNGTITMATKSFSPQLPGWADLDLWKRFKSLLASGVGGRTSPINCANNAPGWFSLNPVGSNLVHICSIRNKLEDGTEIGEVQIKSNRGVTVEVTVPGDPSYVTVEKQPWKDRVVVGQRLGYDPDKTVLLPAGDTLWVGYKRTPDTQNLTFNVASATNLSTADTMIRAAFDLVAGDVAIPYWAASYALLKCVGGFQVGAIGARVGFEPIRNILGCLSGAVAESLSATDTAVAAADSITSNETTDDKQIDKLVKYGKELKRLGLIVKIWSVIQFAGSGWLDELSSIFSGGANDRVQATVIGSGTNPNIGDNPTGAGAGGGGGGGGGWGTSDEPPVSTPLPTGPLAFGITGSCTNAGGRLTSTSGNFSPNHRYSIVVWRPDGSQYPLGKYDGGKVAGDGTIRWYWDCAGDPAGTWTTEVTDTATGRTTGKVTFTIGGSQPDQPTGTWSETVGGVTNTWSDYTNAGGSPGPRIPKGTTVDVSCRIQGWTAPNGNNWWYRIASPGYDNSYYASADAFYNNGATTGSLVGTPYFDPEVQVC